MDMAARILDKLRQSPFSVEELAFDLERKPFEVRLLVNTLLLKGSIVRLNTDREGGPFYAMPDYVKASEKRDHSDQRLYRNYGGQIYDSPAWTDDA